jgi:hypothetical protein
MGRRARARAMAEFSLDTEADRIVALYRRIREGVRG